MPAPWMLALALVVGLLMLVPARRLRAAGLEPSTIGFYAVVIWALTCSWPSARSALACWFRCFCSPT